jgi:hypothetical protein
MLACFFLMHDLTEVTHVVQSMQTSGTSSLHALCRFTATVPTLSGLQSGLQDNMWLLPRMLHPPMWVWEGGLWVDPCNTSGGLA